VPISIEQTRMLATQLDAVTTTPQLDLDMILAHCLERDRSYLRTWPATKLDEAQWREFDGFFQRRLRGEPVAYLLGKKAFWTLELGVTSDVLIPRPETELLVEWLLECSEGAAAGSILDLGTGSGAIALALASELPAWSICAVDNSAPALAVAKKNLENLMLPNVTLLQSDWFEAVASAKFDIIVSNPPYVRQDDPHITGGSLDHEPRCALVSEQQGLADLKRIIARAPDFLQSSGRLAVEHGYDQGEQVRDIFSANEFETVETRRDLGNLERATMGRLPG